MLGGLMHPPPWLWNSGPSEQHFILALYDETMDYSPHFQNIADT